MSKAHPGQSKQYSYKISRRKERSNMREILSFSKDLTMELYPDEDIKSNKSMLYKVRRRL